MAKINLSDQLRTVDIPPPPDDFTDRVHRQLNDWLLTSHLLDFVVRALPMAFGHFARAVVAALVSSLTGRFDPFPSKGENDER